jgi:hypothetical protein
MPKELNVIERYEEAIKNAKAHIKEQEEEISQQKNLVEQAIEYLVDRDPATDEKTAYRRAYQLIYHDDWLDYIPSKYMEDEEHNDWFDRQHDRMICAGDYIANATYEDIMNWNLQDIKKMQKGGRA